MMAGIWWRDTGDLICSLAMVTAWRPSADKTVHKTMQKLGRGVVFLLVTFVLFDSGSAVAVDETDLKQLKEQNACEGCDSLEEELDGAAQAQAPETDADVKSVQPNVIDLPIDGVIAIENGSTDGLDLLSAVGAESPVPESRTVTTQLSSQELYEKGRAHEAGDGVVQNAALAWSYYLQAAEQDHIPSQYRLAEMSFYGIAVPLNYSRAAEWYELAAEAGDAKAQWMLGKMYARGTGVLRDHYKGQYWLEKAIEGGVHFVSEGGGEGQTLDNIPAAETVSLVEFGEPNLEIIVEGLLSAHGEEVRSIWEAIIAQFYSLVVPHEELEFTFFLDDAIRFSETNGEVVIAWPAVTFVIGGTSSEKSSGPLYIETPPLEYRAIKIDDDKIGFGVAHEEKSITVRDGAGALLLLISSASGAITAQWSKSLKMLTDVESEWLNIE
ncbi:MAG: tetratricopeptide repeat protein, partial [Gammaproteobacteria bacterium]